MNRKLQLENLEQRRVFAGASIQGFELVIEGTTGDDQIYVRERETSACQSR